MFSPYLCLWTTCMECLGPEGTFPHRGRHCRRPGDRAYGWAYTWDSSHLSESRSRELAVIRLFPFNVVWNPRLWSNTNSIQDGSSFLHESLLETSSQTHSEPWQLSKVNQINSDEQPLRRVRALPHCSDVANYQTLPNTISHLPKKI